MRWAGAALLLAVSFAPAVAQTANGAAAKLGAGTVVGKKPAARAKPEAPVAAKTLFGAVAGPTSAAAQAIGFYARGCIAGAKALPVDGPAWQAMRLSRNRNWGHPNLIHLIERLATDTKAHDGWSGLLVGDMSQPRGGPMITGHASHQVGLDVDIWLTPMPAKPLSRQQREELSAKSMLAADGLSVDPSVWSDAHARLIRRAASYPEVERIFVHPAIKKALCEAAGSDRDFLHKVRPYWGHQDHMHVRIACPKDSEHCQGQPALSAGDGCGKELDDWFALLRRPRLPPKPGAKPAKPRPPLTLAQLPAECRAVLNAGVAQSPVPGDGKAGSVQPAKGKR